MAAKIPRLENQIQDAWKVGGRFRLPPDHLGVSKVLFCGMGGSGISGDILQALTFQYARFPFFVLRSYNIPHWVDRETLVILSSYSGKTKEVLTACEQSRRAKAKLLAVTSGGTLAQLAQKNKFPCLKVPGGLQPRFAVGYLTCALLPVFRSCGWLHVTPEEVSEAVQYVRQVPSDQVKSLAAKLRGRLVRFYAGGELLAPIAFRWQTQLAENAKALSSHWGLPEAFHNDVEGWQFPAEIIRKTTAVFLMDRDEPAWLARKRVHFEKELKKAGASALEVKARGKHVLARLFSLVAFGDQLSLELARLNRVNPMTIPIIQAIKKK